MALVNARYILGVITRIVSCIVVLFYALIITNSGLVRAIGILYTLINTIVFILRLAIKDEKSVEKLDIVVTILNSIGAGICLFAATKFIHGVMSNMQPELELAAQAPPSVQVQVNNPNGSVQIGLEQPAPLTRAQGLVQQANQS